MEFIPGVFAVDAPDGDQGHAQYRFDSESAGGQVMVDHDLRHQPAGLQSGGFQAGVKLPNQLDLAVVKLDEPGTAAGVFTRNRCASPAVRISRDHLQDGAAQALIVVSKNANLFTPTADADTMTLVRAASQAVGVAEQNMLVSCTGVIGVTLPVERVVKCLGSSSFQLAPGIQESAARAIMTTDRQPKICSTSFGGATIAAMAKGAGMVEPNMATMLVYFFTDLALPAEFLKQALTAACDRTFNSMSVDSDTSTSDSVIVMSTGKVAATTALMEDFRRALGAMCLKLCRDVAAQSEGATKLIQVVVKGAASEGEARRVGKLVVNSPLVKTAVFGCDPNWGRIVMAIGKPGGIEAELLSPRDITIELDGTTLYDRGQPVAFDLQAVSERIGQRKKTDIVVRVGQGPAEWVTWGCDLSYEYVKTNAEYTT